MTVYYQVAGTATPGGDYQALTGSVTITNPGQAPQNQALTGTVSTGGSFSATVGAGSNGANLAGTASATGISGTFASLDGQDGGTFSVTR